MFSNTKPRHLKGEGDTLGNFHAESSLFMGLIKGFDLVR
jgi:hypothetical protein